MKIIQSFNGGFNSRGASGLCGRERKRESVWGCWPFSCFLPRRTSLVIIYPHLVNLV
ncbi:hypothetical protein IC575_003226 [Cucumis melo]